MGGASLGLAGICSLLERNTHLQQGLVHLDKLLSHNAADRTRSIFRLKSGRTSVDPIRKLHGTPTRNRQARYGFACLATGNLLWATLNRTLLTLHACLYAAYSITSFSGSNKKNEKYEVHCAAFAPLFLGVDSPFFSTIVLKKQPGVSPGALMVFLEQNKTKNL